MPADVLAEVPAAVRSAADVDAPCVRREHDRPATVGRAAHPVDLLAEEEVPLVERTHLVEHGAADQQACPPQPLDLALARVVEARPVERVQRAGPRRELAEVEVLGGEPPGRRVPAHRALERAVRVLEARPDRRGPRVTVRRRDEGGERAVEEPGVSVQQEHVLRGGGANAGVPARGEPAVLALDDAHCGKPLTDDVDGAVARAVVDHDGIDLGDALQALLDPGQRVVRDDHARSARVGVSHARAGAASGRP